MLPGSPEDFAYALRVAQALRHRDRAAVVETDLSGRGFARGFTRANQILMGEADYPFRVSEVRVVSVGSQERSDQTVKIKTLSARREEAVPLAALSGGSGK